MSLGLPEVNIADLKTSSRVCMYVDFYISAVSAWTLTTPGVTWDLDKTCKASNVSMCVLNNASFASATASGQAVGCIGRIQDRGRKRCAR
jgi:hypothetical protein